jgi:hypothetical protein
LCGDVCLLFVLPVRSLRADEPEDEETLGAVPTPGGGCVVRARDDLRGDIAMRILLECGLRAVDKAIEGQPRCQMGLCAL